MECVTVAEFKGDPPFKAVAVAVIVTEPAVLSAAVVVYEAVHMVSSPNPSVAGVPLHVIVPRKAFAETEYGAESVVPPVFFRVNLMLKDVPADGKVSGTEEMVRVSSGAMIGSQEITLNASVTNTILLPVCP